MTPKKNQESPFWSKKFKFSPKHQNQSKTIHTTELASKTQTHFCKTNTQKSTLKALPTTLPQAKSFVNEMNSFKNMPRLEYFEFQSPKKLYEPMKTTKINTFRQSSRAVRTRATRNSNANQVNQDTSGTFAEPISISDSDEGAVIMLIYHADCSNQFLSFPFLFFC